MDRRTFVAAGASAIGAVAAGAGVGATARGRPATLTGWMTSAGRGPGHLLLLRADGSSTPTLIYATDATRMRAGRVTVRGRLFEGRFRDDVTGHAAPAVLTEATLV
ncbi:MAG TPA: hypothetical protein VMT68_19410 [Caulobacteraceae bacterium]|nr:hypothetical protein [Caulobacteraceae bacterium]